MTVFTIEVKDSEVIAALNRLQQSALRPEPALKAIGEALLVQTRRTFEAPFATAFATGYRLR
jgi:hypothetical protein